MRVPVKLLGCVFWFFFFNCAQSQAKQKCPDLSVENGFIHTLSSNKDEIFYSCNTGYKPFSGSWWDSVTCSRGYLSEEPKCIREKKCDDFPSFQHGKLKQTRQGTVEVECDPGFKPTKNFIKCVSGTWETPVCEAYCGIPQMVENALITSKPEEFYGDGSSVTYVCRSSFSMNGKNTVFCRSGTWEEAPTCKETTCVPLNTAEDLIMERFPYTEGPVKPGQKLIFSCNREGLKLKGQREITCQSNGEWSSPFPKCEEVMCVANLTVNMRSDVTEDEHSGPEVSVRPGRTITLSCVGKGMTLQGYRKITCLSNGQWNVPFPKCMRGKCGPPPPVDSADTREMTKKEYNPGERVEYTCFNVYTLDQSRPYSRYLTCEDGEWRGKIKCLRKCGPPPPVDFADTREMTKKEYNSGERVEYTCFNVYTLVQSHPYSRYLTCEDGEWRGKIKCLKPCSVSAEVLDERGIELRWRGREKIFSPHRDVIEFSCKKGKYSRDRDLRRTCIDGEMNLPLCV